MFIVNFADIKIKINNIYDYSMHFCHDYIIDSESFDFEINVSQDEIQLEHDESLPNEYSLPYCEAIVIYRKIALNLYKYNAFVMHGAVIKVDDDGYMFLAKSGVGKSTHINLYLNHFKKRAKVVNGDKPIIRLIDNKFYAYGTPYNGKENLGDKDFVELKGLCFLKRGLENKAYPLSKDKASILLFNQILLPSNEKDYDILISLLDKMITNTPLIQLECNMLEEACKVSYEALGGRNYEN